MEAVSHLKDSFQPKRQLKKYKKDLFYTFQGLLKASSLFPCRGLHAAIYFSFTDCGSSLVLYGAGCRPEYSAGEHRCVETHLPQTGGDWLLQLCGESF